MLKNLIRPASNIAIVSDLDDCIIYKTHCACLSEHDIHTLILEIDRELEDISMTLYARVAIDEYYGRGDKLLLLRLFWRVKYALKILFTGHLDLEASYLFTNEQSVHDYIKALEYGLGRLSLWNYRLRNMAYMDDMNISISRAVRDHKWEKEKKEKKS